MASIVIADESGRFECRKCLDGKIWRDQGRDEGYINTRIQSRLKMKGCTSETKKPVFRLDDGTKIHRCPRAIADQSDSLFYYREYFRIRDGVFSIKSTDRPWKWHRIIDIIRSELARGEKSRINDLHRKSQQQQKGPKIRGKKGRR